MRVGLEQDGASSPPPPGPRERFICRLPLLLNIFDLSIGGERARKGNSFDSAPSYRRNFFVEAAAREICLRQVGKATRRPPSRTRVGKLRRVFFSGSHAARLDENFDCANKLLESRVWSWKKAVAVQPTR